MKNLAIIPARSGSKGLKDKNIKKLNNKPLIYYSIVAALEAGIFDEVMVSTDSEKYADIAKECGAAVPFLRSYDNADDRAGSWDVVKEVLDCYEKRGMLFDTVCLLQPTSPLRKSSDIAEAYKLFEKKASVAVVSVCETDHSPLLANVLPNDKSLEGFIRQTKGDRRQDLGVFYRLNGAIYIVYVKELRTSIDLYKRGSFAYVMPRERSVDIDSELDFEYAEFLMKEHNLAY